MTKAFQRHKDADPYLVKVLETSDIKLPDNFFTMTEEEKRRAQTDTLHRMGEVFKAQNHNPALSKQKEKQKEGNK